jgi:hypothetical protein
LEQMMARIQYSGYDKKFRIEVLRSDLKAYENIQKLDASGESPMYSIDLENGDDSTVQERNGKSKINGIRKVDMKVSYLLQQRQILTLRDSMRERSGVWNLRSKRFNNHE